MKDITIKEIYTGKPDAKDEVNFDGIDDFIKTFVLPSNFDINKMVDGSNCFITGYKGTGKTALLFFLDNYIKRKDSSCCTSFIFFKDEYSDMKKNNLERLSKRITSSVTIENDTLLNNTDFEYIWRWIFFKRIVSDNLEFNNGLFINNDRWHNFQKLVDGIKDPHNTRKTIIPSKIQFKAPIKEPTSQMEITPEIEVDFNKAKSDYEYYQFIDLIDKAEMEFASLERTDIPYYIFVDELEAYYGDEKIFHRDLYLIRDLIFTVKRFNEMFFKLSDTNTKIICSIRSEILTAISRFIVSKELNKVTSGFSMAMQWNYSNTSSHLHPIVQILLKRIGVSSDQLLYTDKDFLDIYNLWLPEKIQAIEPANYILNNSWFKPRDIVRLLLAMQNSIASSKNKMTQEVFSYSQKQYSLDSLDEIKEEMKALYNPSQIDEIISCFNGFTSRFSVKELKKRINKLFPQSLLNTQFVDVINDLYRLGFLGNYFPSADTYRWQHKGDEGVILRDDWRLMIHYALQSSLSVGRKQDYSMEKKTPPQVGDIVTGTVTGVGRYFVYIEFFKNHQTYKGRIHISEVADEYINSLDDYFSVKDEVKLVILDYLTDKECWSLSKRRVVEATEI